VSDESAPPESVAAEPELLHGCPVRVDRSQTVVFATPATYGDLMRALVDEGYEMCVDLTGVDYLTHPGRLLPAGIEPERFEVVVNLLDLGQARRVRVRVQVPESEPEVPSMFDLWPGTEAMEREVFDMFGIRFAGHPDLTRILMPEDWIGHPLRKDYAEGRIPVQFKEADRR
jgi:NADH-quinone oxidoreductase subunit C